MVSLVDYADEEVGINYLNLIVNKKRKEKNISMGPSFGCIFGGKAERGEKFSISSLLLAPRGNITEVMIFMPV